MILEAMAYSVPVISSNCPSGPSDIIKHNDNGIIFETNDVNGLSESLNHLARTKKYVNVLPIMQKSHFQNLITKRLHING